MRPEMLAEKVIAEAKRETYGTANVANKLEGDYGTWDDWTALVRGVAKAAAVAERERCARLCEQWDATNPKRLADIIMSDA